MSEHHTLPIGDSIWQPPRFAYLDAEQRRYEIVAATRGLRERRIRASDGTDLSVYEAGDPLAPSVVMVNPLGISCILLSRLALDLAKHFHVVMWESRGLPEYAADGEWGLGAWPLEVHARDCHDVVAATRTSPTACIAYCSGANVALAARQFGGMKFDKLCLVSPSLAINRPGARTAYQSNVLPLWGRIVKEGPKAAALVRILVGQARESPGDSEERELLAINGLPFRSDEFVYRYAQLLAGCAQMDADEHLARMNVPTLVVHSRDDGIIHADSAQAIADSVHESQMRWVDDGGHFAIYRSQRMRDIVVQFLTSL